MNSSDIIAIVAIVVSAIVSIVSTTISYLNNKENITARRKESVFEKKREAFKLVVERMSRIDNFLSHDQFIFTAKSNSNDAENRAFYEKLTSLFLDSKVEFDRQRIYFPPEIAQAFQEYFYNDKLMKQTQEFNEKRDLESLNDFSIAHRDELEKFILLVQNYVEK